MKINSSRTIQLPQIPKHLPIGSLAALEDYGEYTLQSLSGCNLSDPKVSRPVFEKILFRRVVLGPSQHAKPRFIDCRLEASDLSGIVWDQARFRRVEFLACRLIGAQLLEAEFEDITFRECNLEKSVFSLARFKAVRFDSCVLRETSFESSDLSAVVFADCDLTQVDLRQAKLGGADFRGSRLGGIQVGAQELKGVVVDSAQALQIAALIGLIIKERGEELDQDSP